MKELKNELCRCMGALATVEPGTEEHTRLVADVDRIMRLLWLGETREQGMDQPDKNEAPAEKVPVVVEAPAPVVKETQPEPEPEPEPEPTLTKAEVKAKLLTLSNKYDALDLSAVMGDMGYAKLSDVPGERYKELLTRAEDAVKELVS